MEDRDRLSKLEGSFDWMKVTVALIGAVLLGGFSLLSVQITRLDGRIDRLEAKVDAIPRQLSDEFRAMRAEMSAQTSAIANSITATRQVQPQVIFIPTEPPANANGLAPPR